MHEHKLHNNNTEFSLLQPGSSGQILVCCTQLQFTNKGAKLSSKWTPTFVKRIKI